jgi:hypothetical protein
MVAGASSSTSAGSSSVVEMSGSFWVVEAKDNLAAPASDLPISELADERSPPLTMTEPLVPSWRLPERLC